MTRPGIIRDCQHPRQTHDHGTLAGYAQDLCRCQPCRDAHAARARWRRRQKAYGRHVPKSVPNVGVRRRVEALATLGWSMCELSRRCGWHPDRLSKIFKNYDGISPRNAERIAALYDELWATPAPENTRGQKIAARRSRLIATRGKYLPPLAWDDDTIDDPAAQPNAGHPDVTVIDEVAVQRAIQGERIRLTKRERAAAITELDNGTRSANQVGSALRIAGRTVQRHRTAGRVA